MVLSLRTAVIAGMMLAAFILLAGATFAKPSNGTRPGWGLGDANHTHTGPPGGPSVHPGQPGSSEHPVQS